MTRPALLPLLLALTSASAGAHIRPEDPAALHPARFQVAIEEGAPWGEHGLYVRLYPPGRGIPRKLPFVAATMSGRGMAAFEVPPARHAPRLPAAGWGELGPVPPPGAYDLRVSAGEAGTRRFKVFLTRDEIRLEPRSENPNLTVAMPVVARLPPTAFTYRFDFPEGCDCNRAQDRAAFHRKLRGAPGLREVRRPARPLSDSTFEHWLDEGEALCTAADARVVYEALREMAAETGSDLVVRWYGGRTWDLRDVRNHVIAYDLDAGRYGYLMPHHLR